MKKIISNQKGATLLELIVSLSIVLMLTIGVSGMIFNAINYQVLTEKKRNATNLGQMILEELSTVEEVEIQEVVEIELPSLNNLKKSDSITAIEGKYEQEYGSYQASLQVTKALSFESEDLTEQELEINVHNTGFVIDNLPCSSLIIKHESDKMILSANNRSIPLGQPKLTLIVNENTEKSLSIQNDMEDWLIVDVKYMDETLSKLKLETLGKVKVRHLYNEQTQSDTLEEFYHLTLTISLDNQELFKSYGNQFLKVREGESGEEKKEGF